MNIHWPFLKIELALILFTLAVVIIDIFLPNDRRRGHVLAQLSMTGLAGLFAALCFQWGQFGATLSGSFVQDGMALIFKAIFIIAAFMTIFMMKGYEHRVSRGHGEFVLLVLFALIGMLFLASANDFLLFFVALEILSISLYIMTSYLRNHETSIEAGVKYLVLGALSTAIFVYGLSFVYGATGSTSYFEIQAKLAAMPSLPVTFIFGMVLVISALCFKIAAVPFHLWAPDIYQGAPTPVTSFLAIGSKAAGFAALLRICLIPFSAAQPILTVIFSILAALTIFYGNIAAIPQTNIKRLLGYSSIGHAGYLLIGLASFAHSGKEAILFYLVSYLFSTGGAFLVIVAISRYLRADEISELNGLGQKSPIMASGMMIALLSLAGVPPLSGFFAKFYILWSGVKAGLLWLVVIGVLNVITSLYYYLKILRAIYIEKPADAYPIEITAGQKVMQYGCMAAVLILGIFQGPLVALIDSAFSVIIR